MIRSTIEDILEATVKLGSRPPGLLVTGWSCTVLVPLTEKWSVEDGLGSELDWVYFTGGMGADSGG